MVRFQVASILCCLSRLAVADAETTSSGTPSTLLFGRSRSVVGGATEPQEHESILNGLNNNKIDPDDEVIYVRKRDGRGEPLDGDKVSVKTNRIPKRYTSLVSLLIISSFFSLSKDSSSFASVNGELSRRGQRLEFGWFDRIDSSRHVSQCHVV